MADSTTFFMLLGVKEFGDRSISPIQGLGALIIVYTVALFVGLLICSQLRWGFGFENLALDSLKCLIVGVVVILSAFFINGVLIPLTTVPHIMLFMFPIIYLATKACWREVKWQENLLANGMAVLAACVALFFVAQRVVT